MKPRRVRSVYVAKRPVLGACDLCGGDSECVGVSGRNYQHNAHIIINDD